VGAQRENCKQIVEPDGDCVIYLRANQETLRENVKLPLNDMKNREFASEEDDADMDELSKE
jgi:hypothetical protein